jgi:hypothetical protein
MTPNQLVSGLNSTVIVILGLALIVHILAH